MAEVQLPTSQIELDEQNGAMEVDEEVELEINDKIEILKGFESDLSAATYCLHNEDHTLGNALRYMLMKNPSVEFCGYSNPHPSEPKIHLRIQMYDQKSSLTALRDALDNLDQLFQTIGEEYEADLAKDEYERFEEPGLTEEQLRETVKKGEEIRRQQRDEKRAESKARASVASSLR